MSNNKSHTNTIHNYTNNSSTRRTSPVATRQLDRPAGPSPCHDGRKCYKLKGVTAYSRVPVAYRHITSGLLSTVLLTYPPDGDEELKGTELSY
jgi:hypothetical protein